MDDTENYEPTEEEIKELEELIEREERESIESSDVSLEKFNKNPWKNRLLFTYQTESHWVGWLRINGILWE